MKKGSKLLFAYFSTLIMLVGFFLPNFTYVVNAIEVDANDNLLKSGEITLINLDDGILRLDMEDNRSKIVEVDNPNYEVENCYAVNGSMLTTEVTSDNMGCKVTANDYGKVDVAIVLKNINNSIDNRTMHFIVDVELEKYMNYYFNKIPNTIEYSHGYINDLWNELNLPKSMGIQETMDGNCDIGGSCDIDLVYYYWSYNGAEARQIDIIKTKTVNLVDDNINNDINYLSTFWEKIGVGEEKFLDIYKTANIKDYFWVSSDNTIAKVNGSNKIVGVNPGRALLSLINKETLDVEAQGYVDVNDVYVNKTMDQVLSIFTNDIEIDISNNAGYFMEDSLDNNWAISRFAESVAANTDMYVRDVSCGDGFKDCQVTYSYYTNEGEQTVTTQYFDVKYRGVSIYDFVGAHTSEDDIYMVYANSQFSFGSVLNAETITVNDPENEGQTITNEAEIIMDFDNDYLQLVDPETYTFKTIKEGFTKITLYVGGYTTSVNVLITFSESDINEAYEILNGFDTIEIPYSSTGISDDVAKELFKGIISDKIYSSDLYHYLTVDITMLPDNNFKFSSYFEYNGYLLSVGQVNDKFINGKFNENGVEIYTDVANILKNVKSNYKMSFDDSVKLMVDTEDYEEYVEQILKYTNLDELDTGDFDYAFYSLGEYFIDNYLMAGSMFSLELYYENRLVGRKDFFLQLDFVLDRSVLEENTLSSKMQYINDNFDRLDLDVNVELENDNLFEISSDNALFFILLDQKDKVDASSVAYNVRDMKLNIGDRYKIDYVLYPFGATHANVTFKSSNEDAFTVDENGVITAKSKGWGFVRMSYNNDYTDVFVAVDYDNNEFFDDMVANIKLNYEIPYSKYYEYLEYGDLGSMFNEFVWEETYDYLNELKSSFNEQSSISTFAVSTGEIGMEVTSNEDGTEFFLVLQIGEFISKKYPINYKLVGIDIEDKVLDVEVGEKLNANLKFSEGDISNLRYYVYNPDIASINNGVITGLKQGKTDILVYDKYNQFNLIFTVYVDGEGYVSKQRELVENTIIPINSYDLNGEDLYSSYTMKNIIIDKFEKLNIDFDAAVGPYDYLDGSLEEDTQIFTIDVYSYEFGLITSVTVQLDINAIYIDWARGINEITKDETFEVEIFKYGSFENTEVTSISKNPDVCTVEGLTVTALKAGVCEINHSANGETIKQFFMVDIDDFGEHLENILNAIPNTIEIKADPYDYERGLYDWDYSSLYDTFIRKQLNAIVSEYENVELSYYDGSITEDNQIEFYIRYVPEVKFKPNSSSYSSMIDSDTKVINLTYAGYTEEYIEQVEDIKNAIKEKYTLSIDEMLEFLLSSESGAGLYKYSGFPKDLKKICPDCEIYNNGSGGTDDGTGIYYADVMAVIYLHEEPITSINVGLYANVNIDMYEVEDDQHIERELKKHVRNAYKRYKDRLHSSLFVRVGNDLGTITDGDDIDVDVTKLENNEYEITVDGNTFVTFVHVNILTKELDYSIKVEEIKLNKELLNLEVGDTETLVATVNPTNADNKELKWSSSNEKVVTVKDGKVTAVGSGNAVITVESLDGNAKTTIKVSVIDPKVTGDIDGDGKVNIVDLVQLRKHLAGITTLKGDALSGADVNKDGKVNILDLVKIRKHLAGLEVIK